MKRVYLLRHAQAKSAESGSDFDRPLTDKGLEDAQALGIFMASADYRPDIVYCSGAVRTRETCQAVIEGFEDNAPAVDFRDSIYDASRGQLLNMLQSSNEKLSSIMIIGHNPTIHMLSGLLSASGPESLLNRLSSGYEPATLSVIDFDVEKWEEINPDEGQLTNYTNPQDYNSEQRPTRWM